MIVMLRRGLRRCEDDYEEAKGGREEEGDEVEGDEKGRRGLCGEMRLWLWGGDEGGRA